MDPRLDRLPFTIRSHTEDNKGASVKTLMHRDIGREATWARLANNDSILVATGIIREVFDFDERGCRTQVVTEVTSSSAREYFNKCGGNVISPGNVTAFLHRVLFYDNHLDNLRDLTQLMGLKLLIEGKDWAEEKS
jgi:hypothetical protein